jgi:hypothetical protein
MLLFRYATASARSDGLLLLCGGRDTNSVVSDILLLAVNSSGVWGIIYELLTGYIFVTGSFMNFLLMGMYGMHFPDYSL